MSYLNSLPLLNCEQFIRGWVGLGGGVGGGGITSSLPNVTVHRLVVFRSHTKWLPFLSLAELGYSVKLQDTLLLHGLSTWASHGQKLDFK